MLSKGDLSKLLSTALTAAFVAACGADGDRAPRDGAEPLSEVTSALTGDQRLAACAQDPQVIAGLVSQQVCAGADIFFRETFEGNGRTCATCHSVENNTTIDVDSVAATPPDDPLVRVPHEPGPGTARRRFRADLPGGYSREHRRLRRSAPATSCTAACRTCSPWRRASRRTLATGRRVVRAPHGVVQRRRAGRRLVALVLAGRHHAALPEDSRARAGR